MFAVADHDRLRNDEDLRGQFDPRVTTQIDEENAKVRAAQIERQHLPDFCAVGNIPDVGRKHLHRGLLVGRRREASTHLLF